MIMYFLLPRQQTNYGARERTESTQSEGGAPHLPPPTAEDNRILAMSFGAMVIVGIGNQIFGKLECLPMYNCE